MLEAFASSSIDTGETTIWTRLGGSGPPLLLLHGFPETHLMWHKITPRLAREFTVVATDLRGFGDSDTPASAPDHAPYSMRAIARDQVAVMGKLGFDRFAVAGHDRGARCAYRLALDYPERVTKLAVLDIVPTGDAFARADKRFALDYWIWSFLAAPYDLPERLIAGHEDWLVDRLLDSWAENPKAFSEEVREAYRRALRNPARIHAICEEYRAAATLDVQHDEQDRGRRRITCPVLALWSKHGAVEAWYDPLTIWREWADDVQGRAFDCGHFLPEEAPDETYVAFREFFGSRP